MASILIDLNPKNDTIEEQRWTYRDIGIPFDDEYSENEDVMAVRGSLINIFSWRQGHRILNPDFGNIIYTFLYEGMTDITKENIKKGLTRMLKYEPRVKVTKLDVNYNNEANEVSVTLQYNIPSLNADVTDEFIIS